MERLIERCAGCRDSHTLSAASSATRTCATSPLNSPTTYVRLGIRVLPRPVSPGSHR